MALVAPFLVILILCTIDVGQYVLVGQTVSNASREAARLAARHTTANVGELQTAATDYITSTFSEASVQVTVTDTEGSVIPAGDLTTLASGSSVTVEVACPFDSLRWVNFMPLLTNSTITSTTTFRRE
jgi:Flp pilus assembly protein TadG